MTLLYIGTDTSAKLSGSTLILPAANNIGNIGQLAIDLIVSTYGLKRVGFLESPWVLPLAGNDAYAKPGDQAGVLHTSFEVYQDADSLLTVVQLRSLVIKTKIDLFAKDLQDWIEQSEFKQVVQLTGCDARRRLDPQIQSVPVRFAWANQPTKIFENEVAAYGWKALEPVDPSALDGAVNHAIPPGAGSTRYLLEHFGSSTVPIIAVIWFASEGDNIPDAVNLAGFADTLLHGPKDTPIQWKPPHSWNLLFGGRLFTRELFQ
ncbi:PAC2 family-domain-containing protein [Polychytrium aggregatum]|uniref:PAC2 family-domain-containing protein n=1 Tax=Polychytrium aggregatum TaxID=110093 RepID=UPI0022FF3BA6|nr:PAC2 family-domain-containing protein [Polychytrium aggregatum]KAI9208709.1 PAC2 family-domain-containing protein [Polychytrium aggregatum]